MLCRRLDLARRTDWVLADGHYFTLESECAAARRPPLSPEKVASLLMSEKKFTGKGDEKIVADLSVGGPFPEPSLNLP